MEQLEIHSRSYLVRWVEVRSEHSISWSVQPHKKSVNFGIFKHPGSGLAPAPRGTSSTFETPPTPGSKHDAKPTDGAGDESSVAIEKLKGIGMSLQMWHGKCEANTVTTGVYDVGRDEGGMYALVFDNTFSKSIAKTVTFVLVTYPTHARHEVRQASNAGIAGSGGSSLAGRPRMGSRVSNDSIPGRGAVTSPNEGGGSVMDASKLSDRSLDANFFTGVLQKRRRKRGQGYARRFFSLDFTSSTLSYYHNRRTLTIRGAVPLSLAAIGTNPATREISIDSGAEVWHLKALNSKDFENWKQALETAASSRSKQGGITTTTVTPNGQGTPYIPRDDDEDRDWQRVEELVSRVSLARDVARRIARDMDPRYLPAGGSHSGGLNASGYGSGSDAGSPGDRSQEDYFGSQERKSFWKRRPGVAKPSMLSSARKASSPGSPGKPSDPKSGSSSNTETNRKNMPGLQQMIAEEGLHEQAVELMKTLDSIIGDFSTVVTDSKNRRAAPHPAQSRMSLESAGEDEFFDAPDPGDGRGSQLLTIQPDSDSEQQSPERESATDEVEGESSASDIEEEAAERSSQANDELSELYPTRSKSFDLSEFEQVKRRDSMPPPAQAPPSLIGFLRKNVGKDLSTVAMPVSANEPISLLQKMEETLEYSNLLDEAASSSLSASDRLLYVTAFAISSLSSQRVKERAIRKPFNPMLGETYDAIREDKGYRFVAEKVSHRPVRLAWHAESAKWTIAQSPMPTQKFWGKSAELVLDGKTRLAFPETGARYAWSQPTCYLRNVLAGDKYVEPVGTFNVTDEASGMYATVEFSKAKGMFAGRSEGIAVKLYESGSSQAQETGLSGKWTTAIVRSDNGQEGDPIWEAGKLVPDAPNCYGFTTFAASLNELLDRDKDALPPSDSRRRPDQRAAEEGDLQAAESLKGQLEEAQRERRREMENKGGTWAPIWFAQVDGGETEEEIWKLKGGKEGYWDCRAKGEWKQAAHIFDLEDGGGGK